MKLKKIASLALAGVMAVSMLAGCANKPADSEPTTEPTTGITTDAVIAALSKDTTDKITFTASTSLENTLEKAVQYVGVEGIKSIAREDLIKFDSTLPDNAVLVNNKTDAFIAPLTGKEALYTNAKVNTITRVTYVENDAFANYTEAAIVKELAKAVDTLPIAVAGNVDDTTSRKAAAELVTYNSTDFEAADGSQHYYKFSYTGTLAVTKVSDTTYAVALTVTRNATATATPSKG